MHNLEILIACDMNVSRPWYRDRLPSIYKAIEELDYEIRLIDIYSLLGTYDKSPTNLDERKFFLQNENILLANENFKNKIIDLNPKILILGTADNYSEFLIPKIETSKPEFISVFIIWGLFANGAPIKTTSNSVF